MTRQSLVLKICAIANALLVTFAFVGCPGGQNSRIVPAPIAPPPPDIIPTIAPPPFVNIAPVPPVDPPPPPPFVTIAPYGGNFQQLLPSDQTPAPHSKDSRNEKRNP